MNVPEHLHGPLVFVDVEQSQRECFEALRKHLGVIGSQAFMVAATWGYLRGQTPGRSPAIRQGLGSTRDLHAGQSAGDAGVGPRVLVWPRR